jgi:uncharacterized protein YukE
MSRPADWSPLSDSDPTPGDPAEVQALANRYRDTADEISRQAANLRKLSSGTGEGWDSDAGRVFHDHATELAGKIEKAHHRYEAAAGALRGFVSPLELAQRQADQALVEARDAAADMSAHAAVAAPSGSAPPTPEQQSAEHKRKTSYDDATGRLGAARRRMEDARGDYDHAASTAGKAIRDVIDHDGVHDSFWDKAGNWIHEHAEVLKKILKVIGYIVTVLAIAALVIALFIPVLDVLALGMLVTILEYASVAGTVALLIGHSALATTGDGSWLDVGLDVAALATFGAGKVLASSAEGTVAGARAVAAEAGATRATEASMASTRVPRTLYGLADRIPVVGWLLNAGGKVRGFEEAAETAGGLARAEVLAVSPATTLAERLRFMSPDLASDFANINAIDALVPNVPEVATAATSVLRAGTANAILTDGGMVLDGASHITEDVVDWKSRIEPTFTAPLIHLP